MKREEKNLISDTVASLATVVKNAKAMELAKKTATAQKLSLAAFFAGRVKLPAIRHKYGEYSDAEKLTEAIKRYRAGMELSLDAATSAIAAAKVSGKPVSALAESDFVSATDAIAECDAVASALAISVEKAARQVSRNVYDISLD